MLDIWMKRVKKSAECYEKVVLRIPMMYTRRHATAMSSITRTWFELWLDHSDSMTPTDLCRHLAASCPSFYLRPCYMTPKPFITVERIDCKFRQWIVCYICTCRKVYSRVSNRTRLETTQTFIKLFSFIIKYIRCNNECRVPYLQTDAKFL